MRKYASLAVATAAIGTVFMGTQARATDVEFVLDTTLVDITLFNQPRLQYHRIRTFETVLQNQLDEMRQRESDRSRNSLLGDRKGADTADKFGTGLSAGTVDDYLPNLSVWSSYSFSDFEDDHPTTAMDGNSNSVFFGFDSQPVSDNTIFGFSFGFDWTDTDSRVNGGGSSETESYTISPYVVYIINDNFDVDAAFGFTGSDNDNVRRAGGLPTGAPITSNSDTKTLFGSVNVNYTRWVDNWNFTASTGVSRSHSKTDEYTDSVGTPIPSQSSTLNTISVRGKVMYYWETAQPYVSVRFDWDNVMDDVDIGVGQVAPSNDSTGVALGGGVNFKITDTISGGASLEYTLGRQDFDNLLASVNLRWALN